MGKSRGLRQKDQVSKRIVTPMICFLKQRRKVMVHKFRISLGDPCWYPEAKICMFMYFCVNMSVYKYVFAYPWSVGIYWFHVGESSQYIVSQHHISSAYFEPTAMFGDNWYKRTYNHHWVIESLNVSAYACSKPGIMADGLLSVRYIHSNPGTLIYINPNKPFRGQDTIKHLKGRRSL